MKSLLILALALLTLLTGCIESGYNNNYIISDMVTDEAEAPSNEVR